MLRTVTESEIAGLGGPMLDAAGALASDPSRRDARRALAATASGEDTPRLRELLAHANSQIRLLVIDALARVDDDAAETLEPALADDADPVRLAAARALLNLADRRGLATLVSLMESDDPSIRLQASEALVHVSGRRVSFAAWAEPEKRAVVVDDWRRWLAKEGPTAELKVPLPDGPMFLDRILVASYSGGAIVELDGSGKERWRIAAASPFACRGLPNGHRLVSVYGEKVVYEYDGAGKVVWKSPPQAVFVSGLRRLSNGNTLLTGGNQIVELNRAGKTVWKKMLPGAMDADRLPNGNTMVAVYATNKIVEIDPSGREVWSLPTDRNPYALSALRNGNVLVSCFGSQTIVEYTRAGKKVMELKGHSQAYSATRLPDGRTFVADSAGMHEFDPSGKKLWSRKPVGATVYAHRY